MDSMVSKGAGLAKSVEARLHGLTGVFRTLSEQHGEAGALLWRVQHDPSKRSELWPKIRQELVSHERAELRELYPALREHAETRALAERHDLEATQLSELIDRIQATVMSSDEWGTLFDQLVKLVDQHVAEEQGQIFPRAQEALGAERARQLDGPVLAAKQQIAATL
jgi:hemerythrin superfamily protein